ncbi:MAG: hypothetical protein AVDCRST_MAG74-3441 [uncultured Pyrinomonadaceae bacterium]|uniref:Uncharacterized protein n=1 Tax=uncultured Pyrinomonadaceae bacterium TaxID=2283094 RepID=A0A6J4Q0P1_9BACT|nr:MAG: hypothetical protein AVDCRST_MAG74-3441 [uncultured Pyrinomonadaceae bacterium]
MPAFILRDAAPAAPEISGATSALYLTRRECIALILTAAASRSLKFINNYKS